MSESVGASYLDRKWHPALQESGARPLVSLRQAFLDGSLTRLADPEGALRAQIPGWVARGDFGLAAGLRPDGTYQRVWFTEPVPLEEIAFEHDVYLVRRDRARALKAVPTIISPTGPQPEPGKLIPTPEPSPPVPPQPPGGRLTIRIAGPVPPEVWNRPGHEADPETPHPEGPPGPCRVHLRGRSGRPGHCGQ